MTSRIAKRGPWQVVLVVRGPTAIRIPVSN
jgi:hypothetical protein